MLDSEKASCYPQQGKANESVRLSPLWRNAKLSVACLFETNDSPTEY